MYEWMNEVAPERIIISALLFRLHFSYVKSMLTIVVVWCARMFHHLLLHTSNHLLVDT